ncbi:MAG: hypothetical protein LUQ36_02770 [Methanoregula sp.]|nr:hypothetical protein [Methanoregula sp.]
MSRYLGRIVAQFEGRKVIGKIRAPTIVNASKDPFVPIKIIRELAEGIRGRSWFAWMMTIRSHGHNQSCSSRIRPDS